MRYYEIINEASSLPTESNSAIDELRVELKRLRFKRDQLSADSSDLMGRMLRSQNYDDGAGKTKLRLGIINRIIDLNDQIERLSARIRAETVKNTPAEALIYYSSQRTNYRKKYIHAIGQMIDQADATLDGPAEDALTMFVGHGYSQSPEGGMPGNWRYHKLENAYSDHPTEEGRVIRQQLDAAFRPIREALRRLFGDTVTIHRAHGPQKFARDVYSWTSNLRFAQSLLSPEHDLLTRAVAVDDIIWITDRANQSEFIVRGQGL